MRKKIFAVVTLILVLIFVSCKAINVNDNKKNVIYVENSSKSAAIEYDDFILKMNRPACQETSSYSLSVSANLTNKTYSTKTYHIKNVQLIKESTGASYTVYHDSELVIEAELSASIDFSSTIPSSIKDDHYKLSFNIDSYQLIYYLYEMPEELKVDRTVSYYVEGELVKQEIIKDKKTLDSVYRYESTDKLSYCNTWYTDQNGENEFNTSSPITSDLNLYGFKHPYYRTVKYYVSNELVKTETVKDGESIKSSYIYESTDKLSYCNTWYTDPSGKNRFNYSITITSDLELYGFKRPRYRTINYYVLNELVKTETVKDNEKIKKTYVYDYPDHMFYCDTWYTDKSGMNKFSGSAPITSDLNLYGFDQKSNFRFMALSTDYNAILTGVEHYPAGGVLVVPETYQGKKVDSIGVYALDYLTDAKELYIPKTIKTIYSGNFTYARNTTIYYEGTEEEWMAIIQDPSHLASKVVYNAKYPR